MLSLRTRHCSNSTIKQGRKSQRAEHDCPKTPAIAAHWPPKPRMICSWQKCKFTEAPARSPACLRPKIGKQISQRLRPDRVTAKLLPRSMSIRVYPLCRPAASCLTTIVYSANACSHTGRKQDSSCEDSIRITLKLFVSPQPMAAFTRKQSMAYMVPRLRVSATDLSCQVLFTKLFMTP